MSEVWCRDEKDGVVLYLYVQPGAKETSWVGVHDGRLKVRLVAPPVDGRANNELIKFIATNLKVPKSSVSLVGGLLGRKKSIKINGLGSSEVLASIGQR